MKRVTPFTSGNKTINGAIAQGGKNMFDMEKIMSLTADEIIIANGLQEVAKEAKEAAELIRNAYRCFGIEENKIEVWHDCDGNNFEYLTHEGVWEARYLHQQYDVKCSEDEIFKYFRAEYLIANNFVSEFDGNCYTEERKMKNICRYFRTFLKRTREKYNQQ